MAKRHAEPYRLFKRGDIWHAYISLVLETGERIQLRETTGAVSEQKAVEYCLKRIEQIQKKARSQATGELPSITVDEAFARYFVEKGRFLSLPKQRLTRLNKLKNDIEAVLLNEITEPKINKFITENKPYLSNSTINRYLFLLSAVIKTAKEEWRVKAPDFKISKFKLREPAENIKYLKDWSAAQKIIDRAAPHLKPIIYTALYTGLRESNILNLKWQDIDFKSRTITIKIKDSTREGGKTHTIPIIDKLSDILNSLPKNSEYVFTYPNGQTPSFDLSTETIAGIGVGDAGWLVSMVFSPSVSLESQMSDGDSATLTYRGKESLFDEGDPVMTLVTFLGQFEYNGIEWITGEPEQVEEQPWDKVEKEVFTDVATVSDEKQSGSNYVDITLPKTGKESYPVVLWIHGGGYITGDRKNCLLDNTKEYLLAQGYAFVSAEYTLTKQNEDGSYAEGGMPQMLYDLKAAVRFLRANAEQYKLDTRFIAAMGESAGAGLALLMNTTNGKEDYEDLSMGNEGYSSDIQAAVSFCGPTIFTGDDIGNMYALLGEDFDAERYQSDADYKAEMDALASDWSPVDQVDVDTPPMYLAYSKEDTTVPFRHGEDFYDIATMFMEESDIVTAFYSEGGHVDRNVFDAYSSYVSVANFLNTQRDVVLSAEDTDPEPDPDPQPEEPNESDVGLIVGLSVGGAVIVAAGIVVAVILTKKKRGGK